MLGHTKLVTFRSEPTKIGPADSPDLTKRGLPASLHCTIAAWPLQRTRSPRPVYYRKKLKALPQSPRSLSQSPSSQLRVIIERAGAKRRSPELLVKLQKVFKDEGITTFPPLTDPFLRPDDRVCLLEAKQPIDGLAPQRELLPTEKELQAWIWNRRDQLDEFHKRGLTGYQQQVTLDGGRRVDILCKRPAHNQLVAIELKAARPDDRSAGQVQRYLEDLARHAERRGFDSAHLIVISGQPDKSVRDLVERHARARNLTVEFLLYRVQTKLLPHPEIDRPLRMSSEAR